VATAAAAAVVAGVAAAVAAVGAVDAVEGGASEEVPAMLQRPLPSRSILAS
jgi:hypothetical protein